jgi:hypothetical protein
LARGNGEPPTQPRKFPVTWLSDAQLDLNSRYLVKGLIDQGSFSIIYGPSGSGKSFFTADIAQHIATGATWRGRRVNQSLVVYVASEAGGSILKRFIGWRDQRISEAADPLPLAILTRGPSLLDKMAVAVLAEQLLEMQDKANLPLGLVAFDTLSRSIPGADENSAKDITEAVSVSDYLRDTFKASTTFVHHSGKNIEQGARGHSSLFAAADCVLRISDHLAVVEKVRDGVAGEQFPFSLEPIDLGTDADGDELTTCILSHEGSNIPRKPNLKGLGKNQRLVLEYLRPLIAETGQRTGGTSVIPDGVLTASFNALCERMVGLYPTLKPWQVKKRVNEAVLGLQASGHAAMHNDYVWLRSPPF